MQGANRPQAGTGLGPRLITTTCWRRRDGCCRGSGRRVCRSDLKRHSNAPDGCTRMNSPLSSPRLKDFGVGLKARIAISVSMGTPRLNVQVSPGKSPQMARMWANSSGQTRTTEVQFYQQTQEFTRFFRVQETTFLVPPTGLEPVTPALRMRCSTN